MIQERQCQPVTAAPHVDEYPGYTHGCWLSIPHGEREKNVFPQTITTRKDRTFLSPGAVTPTGQQSLPAHHSNLSPTLEFQFCERDVTGGLNFQLCLYKHCQSPRVKSRGIHRQQSGYLCLLRNLCAGQETSYNQTWNNRLVQNWERSILRLYIVTLRT